jgi:uncharacterized membrane protein
MNIRKSLNNVLAAVVGLMSLAVIAIWQFHLFVTFKDSQGFLDAQGGTYHLWWASSAAIAACLAGFFVFSVFVHYDKTNEMHVTS